MNSDKKAAIIWARKILANSEQYYILDTETTGLSDPEIIELSILDLDGNMIVNQRYSPTKHIEHGASQIHGMTNQTLAKCQGWDATANRIEEILKQRKLLIYNFEYDNNAIVNTYSNHGLRPPLLGGYCVMDWYSKFIGEWNDYRKSYRWQKLPGGDHSALGDCMATLEVIKGMAATEIPTIVQLVGEPTAKKIRPY
jgi:DNA polymerase III subunit epsilon